MNRRDFLRIMALGAGWLMTNGWFSRFRKTSAAQREYYRILLLSDTHLPWRTKKHKTEEDQNEVWEQKTKILDDINSWDDVDEVDVLGDLAARYGTEEEFACVDEYLSQISVPVYVIAGNHDYAYQDEPDENGKLLRCETYEERWEKLMAFTRRYHLPDVYYARTVGKYRMLYLAPDACTELSIELSEGQLDWMKKEISEHQEGPMLFLCHAPLMGTLRTYKKKINTSSRTAQPDGPLEDILEACPKGSLWLSGHTHTPPTNDSYADDSVNRFNDNLVNIHNPTIDKRHVYTNSLYLYEDKTVVRTYDHTKGVWLDEFERSYES
ncbi:metallophosphoesterase family protein [Schwartzia sp. (in: firmicutes)]